MLFFTPTLKIDFKIYIYVSWGKHALYGEAGKPTEILEDFGHIFPNKHRKIGIFECPIYLSKRSTYSVEYYQLMNNTERL